MAFDTRVGHGYDVELKYNGAVDGDPVIDVVPVGAMAVKMTAPFDHVNHVMKLSVDHNGTVASGVVVSVSADGDLGVGVSSVIWAETFNALAAPGATIVTPTVSAERPTPVVVP